MTASSRSNDPRLYPAHPLLAVSLAVFRDDRVLLARRVAPPLANRWTLPGGLVEIGESLADAAVREMREEVAVKAEIVGFNRHVEFVERDRAGAVRRHYVIGSFVGRWLSGDGMPGPEADAVTWVSQDEAAALSVTDELRSVLADAWSIIAAGRRP